MSDRRCSSISGQPRHSVVALVLPGVLTFDLGCAIQVFARAPGMAEAALRACFADDLDTTPTAYRRAFRGGARPPDPGA